MDMVGDKDKFEPENRNEEDPMNFAATSPSPSVDWRFGGLVPTGNPMAVSKGSTSMAVDSFGPTLWDQSQTANPQNLGGLFSDINNVQNSASNSDTLGIRKGTPAAVVSLPSIDHKTFDMGWNPTSSMMNLKGGGGIFLPGNGMLPQSLSQFPADSAFIERAARFSCFNVNGGNFGDVVNPLESTGGTNYFRGGGMMQEVFGGNGQSHFQKNEVMNVDEAFKDVSMSVGEHEHEHGATGGGGSPLKNVRSHDETKQGIGVSGSGPGNDSDEAEFSTAGGQDEPSVLEGTTGGNRFAGGLESTERTRSEQDTELDLAKVGPQQPGESAKDDTEIQQNGDQKPTSTTNKSSGKHGKQGSQASDPPKEEYIHVRARRGQATISHSLAERVRREKINERMKYLQDLVPGCSKVTSKALMLDEIINYIQSLQRQVEHQLLISSDDTEIQQNGDQKPTSTTNKSSGKHGSQASDPPKEEYIYVRARRGQATNSHSLAERVRREKISERMKYLQDLVPGCSKVTGKALMLDEIINYIQSLQQQVEHQLLISSDDTEIQQNGDQKPTSTTNKSSGKHGKQGSQASDPPKEEYIHVRARRGQATNSHSLAERVRREKINERMKYLQDLVPGCSKVTGKALMLDEIINYIQSLQRQVEHQLLISSDDTEIQQNGDQKPTSTTNKSSGKHGSQASDPPKEGYIYVRARRGQATNSHSLAERVRREKISERMKYLQDLVPGCSKVTGKALMLDEIINYVQSLQRQIEFLSMKLATVNPLPDFNVKGLLSRL